jgi:hypothetical protein
MFLVDLRLCVECYYPTTPTDYPSTTRGTSVCPLIGREKNTDDSAVGFAGQCLLWRLLLRLVVVVVVIVFVVVVLLPPQTSLQHS